MNEIATLTLNNNNSYGSSSVSVGRYTLVTIDTVVVVVVGSSLIGYCLSGLAWFFRLLSGVQFVSLQAIILQHQHKVDFMLMFPIKQVKFRLSANFCSFFFPSLKRNRGFRDV